MTYPTGHNGERHVTPWSVPCEDAMGGNGQPYCILKHSKPTITLFDITKGGYAFSNITVTQPR
ncbi:hypothetical protein DPMN_149643 [Dreissena polymorpha]|uniref:Uncharacterized protein n=1 Tax=Dreissena polymorpha TaxID=45954 RepID=A0A9D4FG78_DREPO|nr:hypothetical protein DPMN_149643 [Dreissena polymorpha]